MQLYKVINYCIIRRLTILLHTPKTYPNSKTINGISFILICRIYITILLILSSIEGSLVLKTNNRTISRRVSVRFIQNVFNKPFQSKIHISGNFNSVNKTPNIISVINLISM